LVHVQAHGVSAILRRLARQTWLSRKGGGISCFRGNFVLPSAELNRRRSSFIVHR
jgi:hypothetical protein